MILAPNSKEVSDPGLMECIVIVKMIMQCRSDCMQAMSKFRVYEEVFDCYNLCCKSLLLQVGSKSPTINDACLAGLDEQERWNNSRAEGFEVWKRVCALIMTS